jgi:hypothetical protein
MRYIILILLLLPNICVGQVVYPNYASSPGQAYGYGQAAMNYSYGTSAVDYSIAAMYQQTVYTMYLQNRLNSIDCYFQQRQMNKYYRELEELQRQEIKEAKYSGSWNIQQLNNLYNNNHYPIRSYSY